MKRVKELAFYLSVVACLTFAYCAGNPAPKNVQVVQAADSVVSVLTVFTHAVMNASDTKLISTLEAHKVLDIVKAAALTVNASPDGAKATITAALDQIDATVSVSLHNQLMPYLTTARAALAAF